MPANSAARIQEQFKTAFNNRDIEALLALYEPDAVVIPQPGQEARGKEQIREALNGFLGLNGPIVFDTALVTEIGDLAFLVGKWTLDGKGPDGNPISLAGNTAEVARRQPDGTWRYVFDNPWGEQVVG